MRASEIKGYELDGLDGDLAGQVVAHGVLLHLQGGQPQRRVVLQLGRKPLLHHVVAALKPQGRFYLTTHSTHFILLLYMASDIWLRTILIVREEGRKEMFHLTTQSTHFIYCYMEGRKEVFYLTTHSTHFILRLYMASDIWLRTILIVREEGRKEMFHLTTQSTHFIYCYMEGRKEGSVLFNHALNTFYLWLYGIRHMVKDHSDSERGRKEGNVLFNDTINTVYLRL